MLTVGHEKLDMQTCIQAITDSVGNTPVVQLRRLRTVAGRTNVILCKLEGNNPAGSVQERSAVSMIVQAEARGAITPGATLVEATSANTGVALALAAAHRGYKLKLIVPSDTSEESKASMRAYGAELVEVGAGDMEAAREKANQMQADGVGAVLDQFSNVDNPLAHYTGTGPEIWAQTGGRITHFVSSMESTGTIVGTSRYLKERNARVQVIGLQPSEGTSIPGITRWGPEYVPSIYESSCVDRIMDVTQSEAEGTARALARMEGIFAGASSGAAVSASLRIAAEVENAVICCIVSDRGERYLSSGIFSSEAFASDPQPCVVSSWPSAQACLIQHAGPHFVLFTSSVDSEGIPWCGDCARCLEVVRTQVARAGGTLLEVDVGVRAEWKSPDHPFRRDPALRLSSIPTLVRWDPEDGMIHRLDAELEMARNAEEATSIVEAFVSTSVGVADGV